MARMAQRASFTRSGAGARARVLLMGEHTLVLEALRHYLESELDVDVRVSDVAQVDGALRCGPNAAAVSLPRSRHGGREQLRRLRKAAPAMGVVALSENDDARCAAEAFRLGVLGWVLKASPIADLTSAVRAALGGQRYLTALLAGGDIDALPEPAETGGGHRDLRPRERQVLRLLAEGRLMREVGVALGISTRTVAFHKYRMMETLGVRSTAELIRIAVREELTGPEPPTGEHPLVAEKAGSRGPAGGRAGRARGAWSFSRPPSRRARGRVSRARRSKRTPRGRQLIVVQTKTLPPRHDQGEPGAAAGVPDREAPMTIERVREVIARRLHSGRPRLAAVAEELQLSSRTMQRRLSAVGWTYTGLVDDVRFAAARPRVARPDALLKAVAIDLGFAEQASFTRAFRRWTGVPPRTFRGKLRAASSTTSTPEAEAR